MVEKMIELLLAAVYMIMALSDIKEKKISIWILGIPVLLMTVHFCLEKDLGSFLWNGGSALIVVAIGLLITKTTKGSVGAGDAYVCGSAFFINGLLNGLITVIMGLFLASLCGVVIMCVKKAGWKYRIPFVPFLSGGYICTLLLKYLN